MWAQNFLGHQKLKPKVYFQISLGQLKLYQNFEIYFLAFPKLKSRLKAPSQKDGDFETARLKKHQDSKMQRITQKMRPWDAYNSAEILEDPNFW